MRLVVSGDFELVCCCSLVALSHGASTDPYAAEESGCVVENCRRREPHLLAGSWIGKFAGHLAPELAVEVVEETALAGNVQDVEKRKAE